MIAERCECLLLCTTQIKYPATTLSSCISGTEGRTKLKFGKFTIQFCQKYFRENRAKIKAVSICHD